jgi:hypothetical protein
MGNKEVSSQTAILAWHETPVQSYTQVPRGQRPAGRVTTAASLTGSRQPGPCRPNKNLIAEALRGRAIEFLVFALGFAAAGPNPSQTIDAKKGVWISTGIG